VIGLVEQLTAQQRELRQGQHRLEQLLRWRYGQKRERIDENQLFLFAASVIHQAAATAATAASTPPAQPTSAERKKGHGRRPLPTALQRRRIVYDLDEPERQCPHCQSALGPIAAISPSLVIESRLLRQTLVFRTYR
jgi:hypothetical protein